MPSPVLEVYASALHSQFFQPVYHQLVLHCLPTIGRFSFIYPADNDCFICQFSVINSNLWFVFVLEVRKFAFGIQLMGNRT